MNTKNLISAFVFIFISTIIYSQVPSNFKYQAVLRDANGEVLSNLNVGIKLSVREVSASGNVVFEEEHSVTTNEFGLVALSVGDGNNQTGDLGTLNWTGTKHYLSVGLDENNDGSYTDMGTTQLLSVPYALAAKTVENDRIEDADADSTNELQMIYMSNDSILLSNGGSVSLAHIYSAFDTIGMYFDSVEFHFENVYGYLETHDNYFDTIGMYFDSVEYQILALYNELDTHLMEDMDLDYMNELQVLDMNGDTLFISDGNYVILPTGPSKWKNYNTGIIYDKVQIDSGLINDFFPNPNYIGLAVDDSSEKAYQVGVGAQLSGGGSNRSLYARAYNGYNNAGVTSQAWGGTVNTGAQNFATSNASDSAALNRGVHGYAEGADENIGISGAVFASGSEGWKNVGVKGDANTENGEATAVWGLVYGKGPGTGVSAQAETDSSNTGLSAVAMSSDGNNNDIIGVLGEAVRNWNDQTAGTGKHYGGYFVADGDGFNVGVRGEANGTGGDNFGVEGEVLALQGNPWQNRAVSGYAVTDSAQAWAIHGLVEGANEGRGIHGESFTDGTNIAIEGRAYSKSANSNSIVGLQGHAIPHWSGVGTGNGTHIGVEGIAEGAGRFNFGMRGWATSQADSTWNRGVQGVANSDSAQSNQGIIGFGIGNISTNANYGSVGIASNNTLNNTGTYGFTDGSGEFNIGVDGTSGATGDQNIGVGGYAWGNVSGAGKSNTGVFAYAQQADTNYGVFATVTGSEMANYGVYSEVANSSFNRSGYFDGHFEQANGAFYKTSDDNFFNTIEFRDTDLARRSTVGLASTTSLNGAFTIGLNNGSWKNPFVIEFGAPTSALKIDSLGNVSISGDLDVTGSISKGSGTFKIDHPLDPENKILVHSFVESPEMMNVYNGNITTNSKGFATVVLPDYFMASNKDFRYQLTVMGTFAQAIIAEEISNGEFIIQTNKPSVKVSWQVTGIRADKYAEQNRIIPVQEKTNDEKGKYLHPKAFEKSPTKGINYVQDNPRKEIVSQVRPSNTRMVNQKMKNTGTSNNVGTSAKSISKIDYSKQRKNNSTKISKRKTEGKSGNHSRKSESSLIEQSHSSSMAEMK